MKCHMEEYICEFYGYDVYIFALLALFAWQKQPNMRQAMVDKKRQIKDVNVLLTLLLECILACW